jgi:hypothetical protein
MTLADLDHRHRLRCSMGLNRVRFDDMLGPLGLGESILDLDN